MQVSVDVYHCRAKVMSLHTYEYYILTPLVVASPAILQSNNVLCSVQTTKQSKKSKNLSAGCQYLLHPQCLHITLCCVKQW